MLKHLPKSWIPHSTIVLLPPLSQFYRTQSALHTNAGAHFPSSSRPVNIKAHRPIFGTQCGARRRVIYDDDDEVEEYEYNNEIAMLETYTQSMTDEVLLVQAMVDEEHVEVLIFKGFSSSLSYKTSSDPSRSVIPANAVIKSIDRVKGPFDPTNIQYIEKGLSVDALKNRLNQPNL